MEALRQLWRVLGIIVQGIYSLGQKYWTYRRQKAQQRELEQTQTEPSVSTHPPQAQTAQSDSDNPVPPLNQAQIDSESVNPQIELPLSQHTEETPTGPTSGQWYAPGQAAQIQDIVIADGFIYVGQTLVSDSGHPSSIPGLIDPDLAIELVSVDQRQSILEDDWGADDSLSYKVISPEMRGIFLGWLATGRKEREVPASVLVLFLSGIEYRVIELLRTDRTLDELLALILELERLEVHYVHHQTTLPYIQGLIECCQVQLALSCQPETLLALLPTEQKLSMALKVALGRCIEGVKSIPMTLLWAWYQSSTVAVDLKTPAKRCESAFNFLIQTRGEQQGYSIRAGDHPETFPVRYQPFSPGFDPSPITVIETVDIAELEPQLACLEPLIEKCTNDLDAYSRLIGRSPEVEGTLPAVALLPQELVLLSGNEQVQTFQHWLHQQLKSRDWATVAGSELLTHWPTATPNKIRKKEAELLGLLMEKLGFGYAPDVRYSQATFNPQHSVVLFRLNVSGIQSLSPQYSLALTLLELIPFLDPLAVGTDGVIPLIAAEMELLSSERSRLVAFQQWRQDRPLTWKQALKRVKKLSTEHQAQLAIALNKGLQQNWSLENVQYAELQSLIPLLTRETSESTPALDGQIESIAGVEEGSQETEKSLRHKLEPPTEIDGEETYDDALDDQEDSSAPAFVLDTQLIAQRNQESQVASGLLSDIFTEEEPPSSLPVPDALSPSERIEPATLALGLDEFHWSLLNHLGKKESWDRSEIEAIAQTQGLLLDGALENINDVAFDHCDEALTEGEDPIEVNDWVFDALKAA